MAAAGVFHISTCPAGNPDPVLAVSKYSPNIIGAGSFIVHRVPLMIFLDKGDVPVRAEIFYILAYLRISLVFAGNKQKNKNNIFQASHIKSN
jgi:hypothetical protein